MRNPSGGYTLVEVLIFLAISSVLLAVTIVVIRGQGGKTEFRASANDVHTKLQQWIGQVQNGFTGSTAASTKLASQYNCNLNTSGPATEIGRPVLTNVPTGSGTARGANYDCIFLGKVLQVNDDHNDDNSRTIYAYTVLGRRTHVIDGETDIVKNLVDARPNAAVYTNASGTIDLTEEYRIPAGSHILSSKVSGSGVSSKLAGFFTDLNSGSDGGSATIRSLQYPINQNLPSRNPSILNCIRLNAPCASASTNPWPMTKWDICLANSRTEDRALISVATANGRGATTDIKFGIGDAVCT